MKQNYLTPKSLLLLCAMFMQTIIWAQRDLYLVIGQSNTAGRGAIEAEDMVALNGVDLYNGSSWESAVNTNDVDGDGDLLGGLNRYSTILNPNQDQGLNYAYTFGRTLNEITGNQIGLVVNARGGTNINAWAKGATEDYYGEALTRINAALSLGGSTLKGILWHQGEANRNDSSYLTKLDNLITNFRTDLGIPDLPVIVGQISMQRTDNENFNTNIQKITHSSDANYIANSDFVSSNGLNTTDRTHFNANAQRVLGYRYAAKTLKMIYGYTYVENQIIYVSEDAYTRGGTNADTSQEPLENELMRIKETSSTPNNTRRGLLKFDMSTITGLTGLEIIDANLFMNGNADVDNGPIDIGFYDISTSWSESTVTFNNAPEFSNHLSSSTTTFDIDSGDDDNDGNSTELTHGGADITEYIKDKYSLGTSSIAIGLKSETDGSPQFKFSTKDDVANYESRPFITISYIDTSPTLSHNNKKSHLINVKYTNPIDRELKLTSNSIITSAHIYGVTGKKLKTEIVHSYSAVINTSNLESGTYILVVNYQNQNISKVLIKK